MMKPVKTDQVKTDDGAFTNIFLKPIQFAIFPTIFFILLKEVSTKLLKVIWTDGGNDPWQRLWDHVVDTFGDDFFKFYVFGTILMINGVFFSLGFVFMLMDLTGRPAAIRKYKIQPGTNEPLDWDRFVNLVKTIVLNQVFTGNFFIAASYWLHSLRGNDGSIRVLPSFYSVLPQIVIFAIIEEIFFFYSHWAFHKSRFLYTNIHKKHHEWQATVAYAAIYAHPVEHFISNLLPAGLGPIICGAHVTTMWFWYMMVVSVTLVSHSGYHLPFLPSPEFHDFHHLRFNQCFGVLGILDYIHGTDNLFRQSKAYQRNITLTSFKSAREIFPD